MAGVSKNARTTSGTQKFFCPCGGEVKMRSIFSSGKMKHHAESQYSVPLQGCLLNKCGINLPHVNRYC